MRGEGAEAVWCVKVKIEQGISFFRQRASMCSADLWAGYRVSKAAWLTGRSGAPHPTPTPSHVSTIMAPADKGQLCAVHMQGLGPGWGMAAGSLKVRRAASDSNSCPTGVPSRCAGVFIL